MFGYWKNISSAVFLTATFFGISCNANACMSAPDGFYKTAEQTVVDAKSIYLVRLRSAQRIDPIPRDSSDEKNPIKRIINEVNIGFERSVLYSFDVLETYMGGDTPSIQITVPHQKYGNRDAFLSNHELGSNFWKDPKIGRTEVASDCSLFTSFDFGDNYLIVLPEQWSTKSFEIVMSEKDEWLEYVVEMVTKKKKRTE